MEFNWSESEQALREKVRALLQRELPQDWEALSRHGPGSRAQTEFSLSFCPRLAADTSFPASFSVMVIN